MRQWYRVTFARPKGPFCSVAVKATSEKGAVKAAPNPERLPVANVQATDNEYSARHYVRAVRRGLSHTDAVRVARLTERREDALAERSTGLYRSRGETTGPLPVASLRGFYRAMLAGYGVLP